MYCHAGQIHQDLCELRRAGQMRPAVRPSIVVVVCFFFFFKEKVIRTLYAMSLIFPLEADFKESIRILYPVYPPSKRMFTKTLPRNFYLEKAAYRGAILRSSAIILMAFANQKQKHHYKFK